MERKLEGLAVTENVLERCEGAKLMNRFVESQHTWKASGQ